MIQINRTMSARTMLTDCVTSATGDPKIAIQAIDALRQALAADPALIQELAPGMMLVRRPMTPRQRASVAVPAMNAARADRWGKLVAEALPVLAEALNRKPDASPAELAMVLNHTTLKPAKGREQWIVRDVRRLLKEMPK